MKSPPFHAIFRPLTTGVAALLLLPPGCGLGYTPPPAPTSPALTATEQARLVRGHAIHQAKCATCHAFVDPSGYSERELRERIFPVMARKSELDPAARQAVLDYLIAVRQP
ncbi:MAG: cytochrome c [Akkermansiaceae bacterium]|nr:cytochrome c [Akkermansiaceae bacterium]MCF7732223.1 cytochrome c [Akkermansiaceae bacterium]